MQMCSGSKLTWCSAGNLLKVYVLANLLASGVHLQDPDAALHIRPVNSDLHTTALYQAQTAKPCMVMQD